MLVKVTVVNADQEDVILSHLGGVKGHPLMVNPLHGLAADLLREGSIIVAQEPAVPTLDPVEKPSRFSPRVED